ncbi:MAG: DUF1570 domain-containing protein [Pirellulales bacterium]
MLVYSLIRVIIALVLAATCGCRGLPPRAALPDAHEMHLGQLLIRSNFELSQDDAMVRALMWEREDVCRTLGLPCSEELIEVHLFRDADTYRQYLARHFPTVPSRRAFFVESDTRLAVYAHWSDRVAEDLRHEVAHGYLHSMVPGLPLWLDEGLAEFFEVPHRQAGLNPPHLDLLSEMMREGWRPDLVKLERLTDAAQMEQLDYAEAWAWVYFLLHSDPERRELLTGYLAELRAHSLVDPLSRRLQQQAVEPERMLGDYLAGLSQGAMLR